MEPGLWEAVLALLGLSGGAAGGIGTHQYLRRKGLNGVEDRLDELLREVKKVRRVAYRTQNRLSKVETMLKVQAGGTALDVLGEELPP